MVDVSSSEIAQKSIEQKVSYLFQTYPLQTIQTMLCFGIFLSVLYRSSEQVRGSHKLSVLTQSTIGGLVVAILDILGNFRFPVNVDSSMDITSLSNIVKEAMQSMLMNAPSLKLLYILLQTCLLGMNFATIASLRSTFYFLLPYNILCILIGLILLFPSTSNYILPLLPRFPSETTPSASIHSNDTSTINNTTSSSDNSMKTSSSSDDPRKNLLSQCFLVCNILGFEKEFHEIVTSVKGLARKQFTPLLIFAFFLLENYFYRHIMYLYKELQDVSSKEIIQSLQGFYRMFVSTADEKQQSKQKKKTTTKQRKQHKKKSGLKKRESVKEVVSLEDKESGKESAQPSANTISSSDEEMLGAAKDEEG